LQTVEPKLDALVELLMDPPVVRPDGKQRNQSDERLRYMLHGRVGDAVFTRGGSIAMKQL
jgi:hypothetical protein